jgi:hypothetical protein
MLTRFVPIEEFSGIFTQADPSQLPLGYATSCKNLAQLNLGRLRRIPGVAPLAASVADGTVQIPLVAYMRRLGGVDYSVAVLIGASATKFVNLTTGAVMTGPTLTGSFGENWSSTFYAQKHLIAGNGNNIQEINAAGTHIALTGTDVPVGNLVQSFLDRLYVADISTEEGLVRYSGTLDTVFAANDVVNVKEIPGKVTALAVNSPTTDDQGIETDLLIFKESAIWVWDETRKDLVTSVVGTQSPRAIANTTAGTIFLGFKNGHYSVYLIPYKTAGEPVDIGEGLFDIFNGSTTLNSPETAFAVQHGRFYKLFFSLGSETSNPNEVWLDTDRLAVDQKPVWYGVHSRGALDAAVNTNSRLELMTRANVGSNAWFRENASADSGFLGVDGGTIEAELDLPLNVEPLNDEKLFEVVEFQIAGEANTYGNQVTYEPFAEDASKGSYSISVYDSESEGISRPAIPAHAPDRAGMTARDGRLKITHTLNTRLDILGASIQYSVNEGVGRVRK